VIYDRAMSTIKDIEQRRERMYQLIDQMNEEEDMTRMLQIVQLLEKEAEELQVAAVAFQAKMDKANPKSTVGRFEVVLTQEQRQVVMRETGVAMTSVWIDDQGGTRNTAMPETLPPVILEEALAQARATKARGPVMEANERKIAAAIAEIEEGGPLYHDAVAKMKQDPEVMKILGSPAETPKR
jgi:hypothetical protein